MKTKQSLKQKLLSTGLLLGLLSLISMIKLPLLMDTKEFTTPVLSLIDSITGHSLSGLTVLCVGIFPITNANILVSLLSTISPRLRALKSEGAYGKEKIFRITKYLAYGLGLIMSYITVSYLSKTNMIPSVSLFYSILYITCLFLGVIITQKISDSITEIGLIDGMSSIILMNITKSIICNTYTTLRLANVAIGFVILKVVLSCLVFVLVYSLLQQELRIPAHIVTKKSMERNSTYFSIKLLGGISSTLIFVSMLTLLPQVVFNYKSNSLISYILITVLSVICYRIALLTQYDTDKIAQDLAKTNVYLDGIYQGKETATFLNKLLLKDSLIGGLFTASIFISASYINHLMIIDVASMFIFVTISSTLILTVQSNKAIENYKGFLY